MKLEADVIMAAFLCVGSLDIIYCGCKMLYRKVAVLPLDNKTGYFLIKMFRGEVEAERRLAAETTAEKIKRTGILAVAGGLMFFIPSLQWLIEWFSKHPF